MLELRKVNAFYGHIQALRDVTLKVERGQIVSLLGANGCEFHVVTILIHEIQEMT